MGIEMSKAERMVRHWSKTKNYYNRWDPDANFCGSSEKENFTEGMEVMSDYIMRNVNKSERKHLRSIFNNFYGYERYY